MEIRDDGSAAIDLKGRLGYLEIPQWMLLHEHPLVVGQEFGWNMSFPEQLGPVAAPVRYPEITKAAEGETFVMEGRVNDEPRVCNSQTARVVSDSPCECSSRTTK